MTPIRSFIAVDLSPEVAERLKVFIQKLSAQTTGFHWVEPDSLHLTLRFLGEVDESVLKSVIECSKIVTSDASPLVLKVRGIDFFPSCQSPRVVWAGLEGDTKGLMDLQARLEKSLEGLKIHSEEKRAFQPHLTMARAREPEKTTGVARILQLGRDADFGEFTVKSLVLYKSDLTPSGSRYTKMEQFNLGR